jgi:DNA-binding IclR family transcriptional regulator
MGRFLQMASIKTPSPPAVERALSILELLAESSNGLSLLELRQRLRLPKSSVHCLLVALERRGYLHRNERTGRFRFGLRLFTLANMALSGLELREFAAPLLRGLMQRTGLTVHLAILEDDEAVLVEKVEPPGAPRLATWVGKRMDVHCTGVGKALAAYLPDTHFRRIVLERGLPRHNENTIIGPRKLEADLAEVRRQGYAIDDEEDEIGLRCLGAPVFGPGGSVVAAISIAGSTTQIGAENEQLLSRLLKETAAQISERLASRAAANGNAVH